MHPSLLLSLTLILPLSAASSPPLHLSKTHLRRPNSAPAPPQQYIEVSRPLPFDSLTPSCTLPLLSNNYSSPTNCSWSNAVLHFSAASNGSHRGRIAGIWLSGAELARTSTPDPTPEGTFWNFRKDVTRYASLLRRSNLTLSLTLHTLAGHLTNDTYHVNITFLYYDVTSLFRPQQSSASLELNENPADLIIPISAAGDEGHWFKIQRESDSLLQKIQIPSNTYRAVIEIYVSSHEKDEFWYANPPDYYLEINNLPTKRGHGSYREVVVKLNDNVVGAVIPFPVIYGGGIDSLFWQPLVSIGAFDFPTYELELTPYLGMLLEKGDNPHFLGLEVADALSYWLIDANLHLWLDNNGDRVLAGPIEYSDPRICLERESKFHELDGKFKVEGERKSEVSGWVKSSAGNLTTNVYSKVEFESKIVLKHNGTKMRVKQEVKVVDKVHVRSDSGQSVAQVARERRYPLQVRATAMAGSEKETYWIAAELEHSLKEEKKGSGGLRSESENRQKCRGWMFVRECEILSGMAATSQSYYAKDGYGCYARRVVAEGGVVKNDTHSVLCAASSSS
ncbi:peptide-N4-(N-acetyl-beta-glucosaminyl)asparagine amidase A-like [Salvia miltiorrhiza]|uniref:peptide-N4-(N-acetyl-beta- glucosaminyl)asparagine amidase A-like n=1 Tax=Salvia miltiorrhiza TaxID=226208 RepID=UPI0025AB7981|nr:peptide-N4-(N-acetyl-beta-glucosaminyl)asparagine amidase A-like [Salvia miltiorrhiza]